MKVFAIFQRQKRERADSGDSLVIHRHLLPSMATLKRYQYSMKLKANQTLKRKKPNGVQKAQSYLPSQNGLETLRRERAGIKGLVRENEDEGALKQPKKGFEVNIKELPLPEEKPKLKRERHRRNNNIRKKKYSIFAGRKNSVVKKKAVNINRELSLISEVSGPSEDDSNFLSTYISQKKSQGEKLGIRRNKSGKSAITLGSKNSNHSGMTKKSAISKTNSLFSAFKPKKKKTMVQKFNFGHKTNKEQKVGAKIRRHQTDQSYATTISDDSDEAPIFIHTKKQNRVKRKILQSLAKMKSIRKSLAPKMRSRRFTTMKSRKSSLGQMPPAKSSFVDMMPNALKKETTIVELDTNTVNEPKPATDATDVPQPPPKPHISVATAKSKDVGAKQKPKAILNKAPKPKGKINFAAGDVTKQLFMEKNRDIDTSNFRRSKYSMLRARFTSSRLNRKNGKLVNSLSNERASTSKSSTTTNNRKSVDAFSFAFQKA